MGLLQLCEHRTTELPPGCRQVTSMCLAGWQVGTVARGCARHVPKEAAAANSGRPCW